MAVQRVIYSSAGLAWEGRQAGWFVHWLFGFPLVGRLLSCGSGRTLKVTDPAAPWQLIG